MPDTFTITIDDRAGSDYAYLGRDRERVSLSDFFRKHRTKPEVRITRLIAGDFCFAGEGPKGPVLVGIERKTIKDLLSSKRVGRLSGEQLPKFIDQYDYHYIVVEGKYRTNWDTGLLEEKRFNPEIRRRVWKPLTIGQQTFVGLEVDSYLNELAITTPIRVTPTIDFKHTVEYILTLAYTFNKPWNRHQAHAAIYTPEPFANVEKASTVRRIAYTLHSIGWVRSGPVDQRFKSPADMIVRRELVPDDAWITPKDWMKLDGFGRVISHKVYNELHGIGQEE